MVASRITRKADPVEPTGSAHPSEAEVWWQAVRERDPEFDGKFFYSVSTTGVYCRPSCSSRLAKRENVGFHASEAAARTAGFRPCKRCKPDRPSLKSTLTAKIAASCRAIEAADEPPSLATLAEAAGMSAFHFHRVFKSVVGVTPKAYAATQRRKRLKNGLRSESSVTTAFQNAGFNSSGRFYADADRTLGMTPSDYRSGGTNAHMRFAIGDCTLGSILVAATDIGVAAILLGDDPETLLRELQDHFPNAELTGGDPTFEDTVAKVIHLVEQPGSAFDLPLDIRGTAFQHRVWHALGTIPSGTTVSYSELANRIGQPTAVRAVASACAANTLAVAIPCHRVVRTDGSLSGYRWGLERKRALIDREQKK